jgi:hypothetical protein
VNFVRTVFASTLVLALSVPVGGCDKNKPDGTTPPTTGGDTAATGGGDSGGSGSDSGGSGGDSGGETGDKPETPAKTCEAKVADAPTALFDENVLIRPPINVELVEDNPTKAEAVVSGGFVSACEATVDRMSLFVFANDAKKSAKVFADEFLENLAKGGFTGGTKSSPIVETNDELDLSVEFPAAGGQPASVLYIAVRRRHANFFVIVYQTRPGEFAALKPTFTASAKSLLVKKPS